MNSNPYLQAFSVEKIFIQKDKIVTYMIEFNKEKKKDVFIQIPKLNNFHSMIMFIHSYEAVDDHFICN